LVPYDSAYESGVLLKFQSLNKQCKILEQNSLFGIYDCHTVRLQPNYSFKIFA